MLEMVVSRLNPSRLKVRSPISLHTSRCVKCVELQQIVLVTSPCVRHYVQIQVCLTKCPVSVYINVKLDDLIHMCSAVVQLQGQFCEVVGSGHSALLQDHGGPSQWGEISPEHCCLPASFQLIFGFLTYWSIMGFGYFLFFGFQTNFLRNCKFCFPWKHFM